VIVNTLPDIVAGPDTTLKTTGNEELEVAESVIGGAPKVIGEAGA
jgi:hypothetical protein